MAVHASHASLPCIKKCRFTYGQPYLDADGDPTAPATPDTEISKDGAAAADCAEEVSSSLISGMDGASNMTLTGDETNCSIAWIKARVASGPKETLLAIYPRVLPILESGTAQAGAAGNITLAAGAAAYNLAGCIVRTTGGTGGGGGAGSLNNQARLIVSYNTSTKVATVEPDWETAPDSTTTYDILYYDLACNAVNSGTLTQADIRTAVGLAAANLDTQLSGINAKTTNLPASPAAVGSAMTLANGAITEDTITTPAETAGRPTGILGMIRRVFECAANKRTRDRATGTVLLRNEADDATLETQTQSTSGTLDTQTKGV